MLPNFLPFCPGRIFASYYGVPLITKGKVKGVLELFQRVPLILYAEWINFLEALAGQAAIAIENATLFENLQKSNIELEQAYDATIEGWSHALDLRDHETEGHTLRVTETALELARLIGLEDEILVHMRRGGLLHDIGKLGVPDLILLKPGPLTEEEWRIMRMHPQYAYNWLAPIDYLRKAIEIPYCHHEKWDGSGYPRGLAGQAIPPTSRIFAVVDVWDALTSNRPYRPAWSSEKALEYISEKSGSHFDPEVVKVFLEYITRH
jgi:HD-GYP domain-containing protein (c-di-GMP phosphodiesterase class II)